MPGIPGGLRPGRVPDIRTCPLSRMDRLSRESERCFGLIVETSNEGVWLCDSAGQTTFVNAKIVQMMGFSWNELLGKPISAFLSADGPHAAGATLSLPSHERAENGEVVG